VSDLQAVVEKSLRKPAWRATLSELNAPLHLYRTLKDASDLFGLPDGDGRPIVLLPGFSAGDTTLLPLRYFLTRLGYAADTWGLGINRGHVEDYAEEMVGELERRASETSDATITLIGWSLGGVIAREMARLKPDMVRSVITLGTPVAGGPKYTLVARQFARQFDIDLDELENDVRQRNKEGLQVPVTSIFSKSDGVVGWQASLDVFNPQARNICVESAHITMGVSPAVFAAIARTLADE